MVWCFSKKDKDTNLDTNKNSCSYTDFERRVYPIIDSLNLTSFQKNIIRKRYVKLVLSYESKYSQTHYRYNSCRLLISIGSMILPTLQTIQNNENVANWKNEIFWAAIATSLGVMCANNIITMFTLDRRHIMYAITKEKLKATGWQYFECSGMFMNNTHDENYVKFWNEIEKIIKLQVISEYNSDDKDNATDNNLEALSETIKEDNLKKNKKSLYKESLDINDTDDSDEYYKNIEEKKNLKYYNNKIYKPNYEQKNMEYDIENQINTKNNCFNNMNYSSQLDKDIKDDIQNNINHISEKNYNAEIELSNLQKDVYNNIQK